MKQRAAKSVPDNALDSKAQTYVRILPKKALPASASDTLSTDEGKQNSANNGRQENIQRLEEIRVLDQVAPEDYVAPKLAPMLEFRASLDRQRPMTPQEVTQAALCFIGLCKIDTSKELRIDDRNEARAKNPPSFAGQP